MSLTFNVPPGTKVIELGGGANPHFHPNVDVRPCFDPQGNPTVDFTANFEEPLPIQSDEWHVVFSHFVLEHLGWRKVKGFIAEVFRILAPGGKVVAITADTEAQLKWILARQDHDYVSSQILFGDQDYPDNTHKNFLSPLYAAKLFQEAGFTDVVVRPYGELATDMCIEAVKPVRPADQVFVATPGAKLEPWGGTDGPGPVLNPADNYQHITLPASQAAPVQPGQGPTEATVRVALNLPPGANPAELFDMAYFNGGGKYGGYAREGYWDYPIHELTAAHVLARKPESVLELGCARGYVLKRVQDAGVPGHGLEVSKHCYLTRVADNVYLQDLCKVWYHPPSFRFLNPTPIDLAYSVATFEHIPEAKLPDLLGQLKKFTKRGLHGIDFGGHDDGFDKTHCFPAGTSVLMGNGSVIPIDHVKAGDVVIGKLNDKLTTTRVVRAYRRVADELIRITLDSGGVLTGTPEHPIWNGSDWVPMGNLTVGGCVHEIDREANSVCKRPLSDDELPRNIRSSRDIVDRPASLRSQGFGPEKGPSGTLYLDGEGEGCPGVTLQQHTEEGTAEDVARANVDFGSAYRPTDGSLPLDGRGVQGTIESSDLVGSRSRIHSGGRRRGGLRFPPQGEESPTYDGAGTIPEGAEVAGTNQGVFRQRRDGMQHRPEDDRVPPHSVWGLSDRAGSENIGQGDKEALSVVRLEREGIPGPSHDSGNQAVHDHQAGSGWGRRAVPSDETHQGEERPLGRGGDQSVLRVAKIVSVERITRVGTEVFNLETETHNYFANDVFVHNCTLRPREWWRKLFDAYGLQSHEVVDKEELERGAYPDSLFAGDGKVKLNIGCCTTMHHHGWVNVDVLDLNAFAQNFRYAFQQGDVRNGVPYGTGSVDLIHACHFLEHLTYDEGLKFLKECRRVLKPDTGALRLIVPDARLLSEMWTDYEGQSDTDRDPHARTLSDLDEVNDGCRNAPTNAGKFWALVHAGHSAAYDEETLTDLLRRADFRPVAAAFRQSNSGRDGHRQILRETLDLLPCLSLYMEGVPS